VCVYASFPKVLAAITKEKIPRLRMSLFHTFHNRKASVASAGPYANLHLEPDA